MVSICLSQALKNKTIVVKGDKKRYRDFVYIDDVVSVFLSTIETKDNGFDVYNVCTGVRATVEEVLYQISKCLKVNIPVKYLGSTPGDQFGIIGSQDKANKYLGWKSATSFETGLSIMIDWASKSVN